MPAASQRLARAGQLAGQGDARGSPSTARAHVGQRVAGQPLDVGDLGARPGRGRASTSRPASSALTVMTVSEWPRMSCRSRAIRLRSSARPPAGRSPPGPARGRTLRFISWVIPQMARAASRSRTPSRSTSAATPGPVREDLGHHRDEHGDASERDRGRGRNISWPRRRRRCCARPASPSGEARSTAPSGARAAEEQGHRAWRVDVARPAVAARGRRTNRKPSTYDHAEATSVAAMPTRPATVSLALPAGRRQGWARKTSQTARDSQPHRQRPEPAVPGGPARRASWPLLHAHHRSRCSRRASRRASRLRPGRCPGGTARPRRRRTRPARRAR